MCVAATTVAATTVAQGQHWCGHDTCVVSLTAFPSAKALARHFAAAHGVKAGTAHTPKVLKRSNLVPPPQRFAAIAKIAPEPSMLPMPPAAWWGSIGG